MKKHNYTNSTIYLQDCMEGMKQYPDNHFDLAVVDPPYGIGEDGGVDRSGNAAQSNGEYISVKAIVHKKKDWDNKPPSNEYFNELIRVSKSQIVWGINYYNYKFGTGRIIWDKVNQGSDQSDCEIAFYSGSRKIDLFRYMWRGMMQGKSIAEGHIMQGNKKLNENKIHPTQKPVALYDWTYKNYLPETLPDCEDCDNGLMVDDDFDGTKIICETCGGNLKRNFRVIDTHLGSGSSRIAADKAGNIEFTGFELDEEYFDDSVKRFENFVAQQRLF